MIKGLDKAKAVDGVEIFHAGTKRSGSDILANGGRVLNVCAVGKTVVEARERAYRAVDLIDWPDGFCRRDIGWRAVEREKGGGGRGGGGGGRGGGGGGGEGGGGGGKEGEGGGGGEGGIGGGERGQENGMDWPRAVA